MNDQTWNISSRISKVAMAVSLVGLLGTVAFHFSITNQMRAELRELHKESEYQAARAERLNRLALEKCLEQMGGVIPKGTKIEVSHSGTIFFLPDGRNFSTSAEMLAADGESLLSAKHRLILVELDQDKATSQFTYRMDWDRSGSGK